MLEEKHTLFVLFLLFSNSLPCIVSNITNNTEAKSATVIEPNQIERRRDYSEWTSAVIQWDEAPWMVGIVIYGRIWCAGSLITSWVVLTAAHCFSYLLHDRALNEILDKVRVCTECVTLQGYNEQDLRHVFNIMLNPSFTGDAPPYTDIALVVIDNADGKLDKSSQLRPIQLDHPSVIESLALPMSFVEVTGWGGDTGTSEDFGVKHLPLRRSRLKVDKVSDCKKAFGRVKGFVYDSEKYFCATFMQGKRDACVYDAGAPAVQNGILVGMFLFGPHLCGTGIPAIFVKFNVLSDFFDRFILFAQRGFDSVIPGVPIL